MFQSTMRRATICFWLVACGMIVSTGICQADEFSSVVISTSDGPTLVLKQTAGMFPAADWTLQGSHSLFQISTNGQNPFFIFPGAPTGSLIIGTESVAIGTSTPDPNSRLDIRSSKLNGVFMKRATADSHYLRIENSAGAFRAGVQANGNGQFGMLTAGKGLFLTAGGTGKMEINASGQISFGNVPPAITTDALKHQTGARLTAAGVWTDASSRTVKQDIEPITSAEARDTVRALQPVGYRYKNELDERYVGFIAEDVPELVATGDRKSLAPMDIVGVLTKVVQDQQTKLEKQETTIATLMERLDVLERANAVAAKRD